MRIQQTAFAKINLSLHVRKRRDDGYHELETLFAFVDAGDMLVAEMAAVDAGDMLVAEMAARDEVRTHGEFGDYISDNEQNIVANALAILPRATGWCVSLEKRLPVAAGLGGGSADAGAVFRMVRDAVGLPDNWHARAAALGADVPACVESLTCIGRGTGTNLEHLASDLAQIPVLLVNPRVALSTAPVFRAWDGIDRGPMPEGSARQIALAGRNDLEAGAMTLVPEIASVLEALARTGAWLVRMSGSGATCFALYDTVDARSHAASVIADEHPGWWQLEGALR